MKFLTILPLLFLGLLTGVNSQAQTINSEQSHVDFKIGNMRFNTVKGTIDGMQGQVFFMENDLANSSFNVCVDVATINTGSKKRDEHLREEDFFYVDQYPTICFSSKSFQKTGATYIATGTLTMRGISKSIDLPFSFDGKTFKGEIEVSRMAFDVGKETGTFMVSEKATISIV